ncbi:hypothetical protein Zm00014a_031819 [Zea mays]|uniref:Uncharacterized protein n=1 Tax=Zea mays TaxID=4577 RepID=A0A3L6EKM9_MAIZE|nr:hypothetical protein Zm00014a_031819 [Zea mays]
MDKSMLGDLDGLPEEDKSMLGDLDALIFSRPSRTLWMEAVGGMGTSARRIQSCHRRRPYRDFFLKTSKIDSCQALLTCRIALVIASPGLTISANHALESESDSDSESLYEVEGVPYERGNRSIETKRIRRLNDSKVKCNTVPATFRCQPTVQYCSHRQQNPQIRCRSVKNQGKDGRGYGSEKCCIV